VLISPARLNAEVMAELMSVALLRTSVVLLIIAFVLKFGSPDILAPSNALELIEEAEFRIASVKAVDSSGLVPS